MITVRDSLMELCDVILGEGWMGVGEGWQERGLSSVGVGGLWRSGALCSVAVALPVGCCCGGDVGGGDGGGGGGWARGIEADEDDAAQEELSGS